MKTQLACLSVAAILVFRSPAAAKPEAPEILCTAYPASQHCTPIASCQICHTSPPVRNPFGASIFAALATPEDFATSLPPALAAVELDDADGDGASNVEEILEGTFPGDPASSPMTRERPVAGCPANAGAEFDVCRSDAAFAFKRVHLDFCGHSPTFEEMEAIRAMTDQEQRVAVDAAFRKCVDSNFWLGKDGVLWEMAYPKVRPIAAVKGGFEDVGPIRGPDYYNDFSLFAYTHTDDRDIRDLLLADYFVTRAYGQETTDYDAVDSLEGYPRQGAKFMPQAFRVGMLSTGTFTLYYNMAPLPRAAAAQAYRAYLGYRIEQGEGLFPVAGEPVDYDAKDVKPDGCAYCHSTLDPLAYPFAPYGANGRYDPDRLANIAQSGFPGNLEDAPESGYLLGQPVADLRQWAQVAAESDRFVQNTVRDFWKLLVGAPPPEEGAEEYDRLWRDLRGPLEYRAERMLSELIWTEAYSVP